MAEQQGSKQSTQANQSSIDTDSDWLNDFGGGFDGPAEDLEAAASQPSQSSKPNPTPPAAVAATPPVPAAAPAPATPPATVKPASAPAIVPAAPASAPKAASPEQRPSSPPAASVPASAGNNEQREREAFTRDAQRLANARDWNALANLLRNAIDNASWTKPTEVRTTLLADSARMYRDRLNDIASAELQFRKLRDLVPNHPEALDFLTQRYRERGDYRALYDLRAGAIEATWDPQQRLEWTREAAAIAADQLRSPDLVIDAWERLFRLGDAEDVAAGALSEAYRQARRWDRLADFLSRRASNQSGTMQVVLLRELAEVYLSGLNQPDRAAEVLSMILATRPQDPIANLTMARVQAARKDWDALSQLATRSLDGCDAATQLDVRRVIAESLRGAGELKRAAVVYHLILEASPQEADAWKGTEEYLVAYNKLEALVAFLARRADVATSEEDRSALLGRAATIAARQLDNPRMAITLQERRAGLPASRAEALTSLVTLYDALGEEGQEGLRSALERQLALTANPQTRIDLLRRLGAHSMHRLHDDASAEDCWQQLLSAVPDDREVRDELAALYRKRGDFLAVDRALNAQAWRSQSNHELLGIWRAAAQNIQENIGDSKRAVAAWQRVLDLAPGDPAALAALIPHYRSQGRTRDLIAALESELRIATTLESRVASCMEIARLWESEGDRAAAIAALERVLRWSPSSAPALQALARLRVDEPSVLLGATDVALAVLGEEAPRALRSAELQLVPADDTLGRFFALRRLLQSLGPDSGLRSQLFRAAADASAFGELAALITDLAASAADAETRTQYLHELATIFEDKLQDPLRAFVTLSVARQSTLGGRDLSEIQPLLRLAEATGRIEDALALLEVATVTSAPIELRRAAIQKRLSLCETRLGSAERAFHEAVRLVRLNPHDAVALAEVRRLAAAAKLWRSLDALYAELWDRAESVAERIAIVRTRYTLAAGELANPLSALDHLLVLYRLDPDQAGLEDQLLAAAEQLGVWRRVLPIVEAKVRAAASSGLDGTLAGTDLVRVARLYEERCQDRTRAFELYAEAVVLSDAPQPDAEARLHALADTALLPVLASVLRTVAARTKDAQRAHDLLVRIAALYESLGQPDLARDIHQRIVQLSPTSIPSLRVLIAHRRERELHRELRDGLQQLAAALVDASQEERVAIQLEIAALSQEKLGDPETALSTYAQILDVDAQNAAALDGIRALTAGNIPPALELRRLRIELQRASGPQRIEMLLSCARLQRESLDDPDGAQQTLRALLAETGPRGPGYEPLAQALRSRGAWADLAELIESRAAATDGSDAQADLLKQAISLAEEHSATVGAAQRERLYRALLLLHPEDDELRWRLLRLLRDGGRYQELADELAGLAAPTRHAFADAQTLRFFENELTRLLDLRLNRTANAEARLTTRAERAPQDPEPLLWLASIKLRKGERAAYMTLRERHAKLLPPVMGALVLCHLAELCDDQGGTPEQVLAYYRTARTLDLDCKPAAEGMKALGRRIKTWRQAAALLPDADERELSPTARSARLRQKGQASADPRQAMSWLERAVTMTPDDYAAWDALADACAKAGDMSRAVYARREALAAFARVTPPGPDTVSSHAARIEEVASTLRQAGDDTEAERLFVRAHALDPSLPRAALAVAESRLASGQPQVAYELYEHVLHGGVALSPSDRLRATYQHGLLAAQQGQRDLAITDLRAGLQIDPLHSGLLQALADVLADTNRPASAVQHYEQALLVAVEAEQRGRLYARLARMWDGRLHEADEAGVCYDLAVRAGVSDADVMRNALSYYQRSGQGERAAAIIDELLQRTTAPEELAALWTQRAELALETDEAKAMEAFDMALSYDPAYTPAVDGLLTVLERRGEWQQVVDILEARADGSPAPDRARALRHLARVALQQLGDRDRAAGYLRAVTALSPEREDYQQLFELLPDTPENQLERQELTAALIALGESAMPMLLDLGQRMAASGRRRYAWAILSPLITAVYSDATLKATVMALRKEFEKPDLPSLVTRETHRRVLPAPLSPALLDVLENVDRQLSAAHRAPETLGAARATRLDQKTGMGKTFLAVAERLGLEHAMLTRIDDMAEPFRLLGDDHLHVLVRSELLVSMSPGEIPSLFALALEQGRPGLRLITQGSLEERQRWIAALLAAGGLLATDHEDPLFSQVAEVVGAEGRRVLQESGLTGDLETSTQRLYEAAQETARRVSFLVCGELRMATRLLTRIDESLPKPPSAGKLEDLSDYFSSAPALRSRVAFALSPTCAAQFE